MLARSFLQIDICITGLFGCPKPILCASAVLQYQDWVKGLSICTNAFSSNVGFVDKLYAGFIRSELVVVNVTLLGDWSILN